MTVPSNLDRMIIVVDYDGTLKSLHDQLQTELNIEALFRLRNKGYIVAIATGRDLKSLMEDCPDITTFANYIICLDGGGLYAIEEGIPKEERRWLIGHTEIHRIRQIVADLGSEIVYVFSMVSSEKREGIWESSKIRIAFADEEAAIEFKEQLCAIDVGTVFYEIPRKLNFDDGCLRKEVPEITYVVELMPAGGKLAAIKYLTHLTGTTVKLCAGDAANDWPMIRFYGPRSAVWVESAFSPSDREGVLAFPSLEEALCYRGLI